MSASPIFTIHEIPDDEIDLPLEEVARQLGLPEEMLVRRIEAGDIAARPVLGPDGIQYRVPRKYLSGSPEGQTEQSDANKWHKSESGRDHTKAESSEESSDEPIHTPAAHRRPQPVGRGTVEVVSAAEPLSPRQEIANMTLDPRELVGGLLDRWGQALEQRIYAEQRQRFEIEINNRQAQVKQLQLELDSVRAEQVATLAERERSYAERERAMAERERALAERARELAESRSWRRIFFRR